MKKGALGQMDGNGSFAAIKRVSRIVAAATVAATGLWFPDTSLAQDAPWETRFRITTFADAPVAGDAESGVNFSGRFDGYLTFQGPWSGATVSAHLEGVGGDDINTLNSGVIIAPNIYSSVPRSAGSNDFTLSLSVAQQLSDQVRVAFGKFNAVEFARGVPLVGGKGKGGFQYTGIAAPVTFVFPAYIFGGQVSVSTPSVNYNLFVYDPNNAQGDDFWNNLFEDGVVFNGSATYKTSLNGMPGFYAVNLIHSTASSVDFDSLLLPPGSAGFASRTKGSSFVAFKFQQYLSYDPSKPDEGWGVFAQIGIGDGNPNQLDSALILGLAGTSPLAGRGEDRWGLAWSRYNFSDSLISALNLAGTSLRDEVAVEAFYEAKITDTLRIGANIIHVTPGQAAFEDYTQIGLRLRASF